jgi:hypothetical protein
MSGSAGANLPVAIRLSGGAEAEAAFQRVQNAAQRSMTTVTQSAGQASGGMRNFGQVAGQAGFQIQDFASQVAMGQNALTAFGVQFAQFAGIFGTAGAIAGAVVTVGLLAAQFLRTSDNTDRLREAQEALQRALGQSTEFFETTAERAARLDREQRNAIASGVLLRQSIGQQQLSEAQRALGLLERDRQERIEANRFVPGFDASRVLAGPLAELTQRIETLRFENAALDQLRANALTRPSGAQREQGDREFGDLRLRLDRDLALRERHAEAVRVIDARVTSGQIAAAEADRLRGFAQKELDDGLAGLNRTTAQRTAAVERLTDADRGALEVQRQTAALVRETDTAYEALQRRLGDIAELSRRAAAAGSPIDPERILRANAAAQAAYERATRGVQAGAERTSDAARDLGLTFNSAFEDAIVRGQKLSAVLQGIGQDIARIIARRFITEPLGNAISGALPGLTSAATNFLLGTSAVGPTGPQIPTPGIFGIQFRAGGGAISGGSPYIVGERGPELIVPNASGYVVPNHALGGGVTFAPTYNIDARGAGASMLPRLRAEMAVIAQASIAQLEDRVNRGGAVARTFGRR